MNKTLLAVGIIFLFIVSSITPVVISISEPVEKDELLEKLAHADYDEYRSLASEEYKNPLHNERYDIIQFDEITTSAISSQTELSDGPMDSAWPMKCHDLHHTSQSPYSTAGNPDFEEKWRFQASGWVDGSPVIGNDGVLYFGGIDRNIYAVYSNGTEKWSYHTGGWVWSAPAIAEDGTVYVGSWDFYLYAMNPDGSLKWRFNAGETITSSPAIGDDGTIYFGTMWAGGNGGEIHAVNPNGTSKWRYQTDYHICSDPAIGDDGTIYIGSSDDYLYAVNPNGTLKWRFETGDWVKSHPSIASDGTIYVGSFDGHTYAINPDGTEKWRFGNPGSGANSASIASDGTIIICGDAIYAVNPDGTEKWTFDIGEDNYIGHPSACISSDGTIYVGSTHDDVKGGEIIVVNPDGTLKWRKYIANEWIDSSPCIGEDGTVYIGSSSDTNGHSYGFLHAFGPGGPNEPPTAPTIDGPTEVVEDVYYDYTFHSIDPEGGNIRYWIVWDDIYYGLIDRWEGPYSSGDEITIRNEWEVPDTYIIKARVEDNKGLYSDWTYLEVVVPVNQPVQHPFLELFKQRFPLLYELMFNVLEELSI